MAAALPKARGQPLRAFSYPPALSTPPARSGGPFGTAGWRAGGGRRTVPGAYPSAANLTAPKS